MVGIGMIACWGCQESGESNVATVRDSSGVRLVTHAGDVSSAPRLGVAREPGFIYGREEGDYLFGNVRLGVLESDGSAIVADVQNRQLVFIDGLGGLQTVFGAPGEGPMEIGSIRSLELLQDGTVVLEDSRNDRFALFREATQTGTIPRTGLADRSLYVVGSNREGNLILATRAYTPGFEGPWQRGAIVEVDLSIPNADTIARFDFFKRPPGRPTHPFQPMGEVITASGMVVVGRSDQARLDWLDHEGRLVQSVRWVAEELRPTDEFWRAFEEGYVPIVSDRMNDEDIEQQLAEWKSAPSDPLPIYSILFGSPNGDVWLGEYSGVADDIIGRFDVISSRGELRGRVELPDGFRLLDVSEDRVLGVLHDAVGVQTIAVYEFRVESIQ